MGTFDWLMNTFVLIWFAIQPDDIHPEDSYKNKADAQDKHLLTHQQKVEMGMESEKVCFVFYTSPWTTA